MPIEVTCFGCGKVFLVPPSRAKHTHVFCSEQCYIAYLREQYTGPNNPMYRPAVKAKLSKIFKGRCLSEETRKKQSITKRRLFREGKIVAYNKGKRLPLGERLRLSALKRGVERKLPYRIDDLLSEDTIINYILLYPQKFGFAKAFLFQTSDFDVIGVKEDGDVQAVEVEVSARCWQRYRHKCDVIVSFYNSEVELPVPVIVLKNDVDFIRFLDEAWLNAIKIQKVKVMIESRDARRLEMFRATNLRNYYGKERIEEYLKRGEGR